MEKADVDEIIARIKREMVREVPWYKKRFAAIEADWQTAGFVAVLSALATAGVMKYFGL